MAKASNPFPELVRSHGGVCIFPGILWQLVRNKVYEEYAVHAHLAWCQTCLIVLSENSRSFALKSNWVPLLPISWDFYQTRVKYTVSQKRINRMLLKPWFIGSIIKNRHVCFYTKTIKAWSRTPKSFLWENLAPKHSNWVRIFSSSGSCFILGHPVREGCK